MVMELFLIMHSEHFLKAFNAFSTRHTFAFVKNMQRYKVLGLKTNFSQYLEKY